MDCPDCDSSTVAFAVSDDFREHTPGDERILTLCTRCLSLHPAPETGTNVDSDFSAISESFPTGEAAVPMALVVGLLDSLALYRSEIEELLEGVEQTGTDPLLVLNRLAEDPDLNPKADLRRRRKQVEQFRD